MTAARLDARLHVSQKALVASSDCTAAALSVMVGTSLSSLLCAALCCQALLASGTTVISVGHRPTLIRYHQQVLQLASNQGGVPGKWRVTPAEELAAKAQELA